MTTKYSERTYSRQESCVFRKTKEAYGGLSNMAAGYPIVINGTKILTSEALYQACRYPHLPNVQEEIIAQKSPMTAKMKSKAHYDQTREDWDDIRVHVMRWSLRVKLAQNFLAFGQLLETTLGKNIVEESRKDKFWGALRTDNDTWLGVNALGRLLMELREAYCSDQRFNLLYVSPLAIPNFALLGKEIGPVDCRPKFIETLLKSWEQGTPKLEAVYTQMPHLLGLETATTVSNSDGRAIDVQVSSSISEERTEKKAKSRNRRKTETVSLPLLDAVLAQ